MIMLILAIILAAIGFSIALYIYRQHRAKHPLMCPRRAPCEEVLNSEQATTFGVSNTILGMIYYAIAFLLLLDCLMTGTSLNMQTLLILFTAIGFFFSSYLVGVQHFVIKQWCIWCLGSAATATLLFAVMLILFH